METIFGLHPKLSSGEIKINDRQLKLESASDAINEGIVLVPEDRKLQGLSIGQSVRPNMSITILKQLERWGIMLNRKKEMEMSQKIHSATSH
jgi:ribose transport system ATP-binding protein